MRTIKRKNRWLLWLAAFLSVVCFCGQAWAFVPWSNVNGYWISADGRSVVKGAVEKGVTITKYQNRAGAINWKQMALDHISFAMVRLGYYEDLDPYFQTNMENAESVGLKAGVCFYGEAETVQEARKEAAYVLDIVKDCRVSYPISYDVQALADTRMTKRQITDVINAFCRKIENAGYYPMIYTNDYWLTNKIDMSKVHYDVWVARFNAKPAYQNAAMWQATNQGQVNGISGSVDINFSLKDFTDKLPANRWRLIGGNWYYYKNYVKQTGWVNDGQSWYYQNQDGTQYKGWLLLNNQYYYLLPSTGQMQTGWVQIDNTWYYLKQDGTMATEWLNVDNKWYYLLNGAMVTGWLRIGTDYYYLRGDGSMVTGWRLMDGAYYYFNTDGRLVRGWADIDGERYFFRTDGTMVTGWQTIDNLL